MPVPTQQALSVPDAVRARRSIRRFKPEPIPRERLEEILALTHLAPSAWNLQPWRFVVVQDPEAKRALREAAYGQGALTSAPVVIVLYSNLQDALERVEETLHPDIPSAERPKRVAEVRRAFAKKTPQEREAWGAGQSYIALGYLMLLAQAYGYSSVPMLGFDPGKVKAILNLPAHVVIPALLPLGVADEEGWPPHRHALERTVQWK